MVSCRKGTNRAGLRVNTDSISSAEKAAYIHSLTQENYLCSLIQAVEWLCLPPLTVLEKETRT